MFMNALGYRKLAFEFLSQMSLQHHLPEPEVVKHLDRSDPDSIINMLVTGIKLAHLGLEVLKFEHSDTSRGLAYDVR